MVFGFRHKYLSYGLRIWFPMWFSDFPIWIPVSLRFNRPLCASTDLELPRNLCMLHLSTLYRIDQGFENWDVNTYRFWRFCMRFSVLIESFCGFAIVDNFFVLYRVLNYSGPRSVISSEIVCGFFFIIFNLLLLFLLFWKWRAVVFLTSHLNLVSVLGSLFLHLPALSSISFVIFHSSVNFQCSVTPVFCYWNLKM